MSDNSIGLSSQEMGERFDLLATDAKEYAVFLVGLDGHLLCWNAGAERIFGFQSDEVIGQHFSRFFTPEDIRAGQPEHELKSALADGRADSVCWQVRKDGSSVLVSGSCDIAIRRKQTGSVIRKSDA